MTANPKGNLGTLVKFIDGKYKGFSGTLMKECELVASVFVAVDNHPGTEIVEEKRFLQIVVAFPPAIVRQVAE